MSMHDTKSRGLRAHGHLARSCLAAGSFRLPAADGQSAQLSPARGLDLLCRRPGVAADQSKEPSPAATWSSTGIFIPGRIPGANAKAEASRTETPKPTGQNVGANKADFDRGRFVDTFPEPVTRDTIEHGYHRYMIYCVVCHDPKGTGRGKIVERSIHPPSFHIARLRTAAGRPHLRGGDGGLRSDALVRVADFRARPLGHRRLHSGVTVEPAFSRKPAHARHAKPIGRRTLGKGGAVTSVASDRLHDFRWGRWSLLAGCIALGICVIGAALLGRSGPVFPGVSRRVHVRVGARARRPGHPDDLPPDGGRRGLPDSPRARSG